jgi:hypothetical protein
MLKNAVHLEMRKLFKSKFFWAELAIISGIVILMMSGIFVARMVGILSHNSTLLDLMLTWPESINFSLNMLTGQSFGALLVILMVSLFVAREYSWRTFSLWQWQGVPRGVTMVAKLLVIILAVFFLTLSVLIVGSFISGLFTLILTGNLPFAELDLIQIGLNVLRTTYALFPQIALTMLLAILTRSTAWSLGIGIGYTLLIEGPVVRIFTMLIGGWPAEIVQWLPGALANAIMNVNKTMQLSSAIEGGVQYPAMLPAIIGVGIYTLIFFGLASIEFINQDLPV